MTHSAKRHIGRPLSGPEPITHQVVVRVTAAQRAYLDQTARDLGVTVGEVVRRLVDQVR